MKFAWWLALGAGIVAIPLTFAVRPRKGTGTSSDSYGWGTYFGLSSLFFGALLTGFVCGVLLLRNHQASLSEIQWLTISVSYAWLGALVLTKSRQGWVILSILSINPIVYLINWFYGRNRWQQFRSSWRVEFEDKSSTNSAIRVIAPSVILLVVCGFALSTVRTATEPSVSIDSSLLSASRQPVYDELKQSRNCDSASIRSSCSFQIGDHIKFSHTGQSLGITEMMDSTRALFFTIAPLCTVVTLENLADSVSTIAYINNLDRAVHRERELCEDFHLNIPIVNFAVRRAVEHLRIFEFEPITTPFDALRHTRNCERNICGYAYGPDFIVIAGVGKNPPSYYFVRQESSRKRFLSLDISSRCVSVYAFDADWKLADAYISPTDGRIYRAETECAQNRVDPT